MSGKDLTHLNQRGEAHMVDVGDKAVTKRVAIAAGSLRTAAETLALVTGGTAKKGDVLAAARLAGIMAGKKTSELIPLCHPLFLDKLSLDIEIDDGLPGFRVTATATVTAKTGVEMEALTAVSVACLTLYDMLKAVDRGMVVSDVRLIEKQGGRSGHFRADDPA